MNKFSFTLRDAGLPSQHIFFTPDGGTPVQVPVPDETFPTELEPSFRMQYAILVREGLIPDRQPVWAGESSTPPAPPTT